MTSTKRKLSVSLDEDLVAEMEAEDEPISSQINEALRNDIGRRRRLRLLAEMLDGYEQETGPADEALVEKYLQLLS